MNVLIAALAVPVAHVARMETAPTLSALSPVLVSMDSPVNYFLELSYSNSSRRW